MMHHMIMILQYMTTTTTMSSMIGSSRNSISTPILLHHQQQRIGSSNVIEEHHHLSMSNNAHHQYIDDDDYEPDNKSQQYRSSRSKSKYIMKVRKRQDDRIDPWLFTGLPRLSFNSVNDNVEQQQQKVLLSPPPPPPPVVGILAQPYYGHNSTGQEQFIAASYIKWIESGGGRSIPIPYDTTSHIVLDTIYSQINGLLLPGGNNSTIPYAVSSLLSRIINDNTNNAIYFPVWGTCLGYEMIIQYFGAINQTSINTTVLQDGFNATNISLPLLLIDAETMDVSDTRRIRRKITSKRTKGQLYKPHKIYNSVTKYPITMNNHHQGIEPKQFQRNIGLMSLFDITSINYDMNQRAFVSTIEPKDPYRYPIYGVQYHPEKNPFEYSTYPNTTIPYEAIDHSSIGIDFSFYLSKFFMNCVRYNQFYYSQYHTYTDPITYPLTNTYPIISGGLSFEEVYIFPNASHWET